MPLSPNNNVVEVKPGPTVYTVLMIIALLALVTAIFVSAHRLTADVADGSGYGLSAGEIFKPWEEIQPQADSSSFGPARRPRR